MDLRVSLIGLIIGFLVGMTGMGGGSLMTPILIIMGLPALHAVGTDLVYSTITKILGGVVHLRQKTVRLDVVKWLAFGSVPMTVLGVGLITYIAHILGKDTVNAVVGRAVGVMLIIVAITLIAKPTVERKLREHRDEFPVVTRDMVRAMRRQRRWLTLLLGAVVGLLVGLTSVGSGTLGVVGMVILYPGMQMRKVVGSDVTHAVLLGAAASAVQGLAGNVDVTTVGLLLIGSLPGVFLGSKLAYRAPEHIMRPMMAAVMLLSGLKLL